MLDAVWQDALRGIHEPGSHTSLVGAKGVDGFERLTEPINAKARDMPALIGDLGKDRVANDGSLHGRCRRRIRHTRYLPRFECRRDSPRGSVVASETGRLDGV